MSKHTPGPWYVIEGNYTHAATINKSTKERICAVEFPDFKNGNNGHALEWQANAYLLAAAPEMYEALKNLIEWLDRANLTSTPSGGHGAFSYKGTEYGVVSEARSILTKIGGDVKMDYYVEVVEYGTDKVVKQLGPMSERKADRVDDGLNINLDHDKYYTRIVRL